MGTRMGERIQNKNGDRFGNRGYSENGSGMRIETEIREEGSDIRCMK